MEISSLGSGIDASERMGEERAMVTRGDGGDGARYGDGKLERQCVAHCPASAQSLRVDV
jgi:hypothetical protein